MKSLVWTVVPLFLPALLCAADLSSYRGFTFGSDIAKVAAQIGLKPSDAVPIHQRPSLIQELRWQFRGQSTSASARPDPVQDVILSFLDGKLYRVVALYGRYEVKGMTVEDLVEAMSSTFGVAQYPKSEIAFHTYYGESVKVLARWQNDEVSYNLINTGDPGNFALVAYSKKLDALSQAATVEAARLDALDAPRRAQEAETKRLKDEQAALEEIRLANKSSFRP